MANSIKARVELATLSCAHCTILFAVPEKFEENRREDHAKFFCPVGHTNYFPQKSALDVARLARLAAQAETDRIRLELLSERERAIAARKETERIKKRAKNGVCPCCHRSFVALQRHMKTKHPAFEKAIVR